MASQRRPQISQKALDDAKATAPELRLVDVDAKQRQCVLGVMVLGIRSCNATLRPSATLMRRDRAVGWVGKPSYSPVDKIFAGFRSSTQPTVLLIPAANLYRLLAREKTGAANEFSTIKNLDSPNTWVAVPVVYPQFMTIEREHDDRVHERPVASEARKQ